MLLGVRHEVPNPLQINGAYGLHLGIFSLSALRAIAAQVAFAMAGPDKLAGASVLESARRGLVGLQLWHGSSRSSLGSGLHEKRAVHRPSPVARMLADGNTAPASTAVIPWRPPRARPVCRNSTATRLRQRSGVLARRCGVVWCVALWCASRLPGVRQFRSREHVPLFGHLATRQSRLTVQVDNPTMTRLRTGVTRQTFCRLRQAGLTRALNAGPLARPIFVACQPTACPEYAERCAPRPRKLEEREPVASIFQIVPKRTATIWEPSMCVRALEPA